MTEHDRLVQVASKWLCRTCSIVITELVSSAFEAPDALGWQGGRSMLVECKTSLSDFKSDAKKPFRTNPEMGLGVSRYFLTPPNLVTISDLPQGWGLIEDHGKRIKMLRASDVFRSNRITEVEILLSLVRRIGGSAPPGISIRCYTHQTQCKATLSVDQGIELEIALEAV